MKGSLIVTIVSSFFQVSLSNGMEGSVIVTIVSVVTWDGGWSYLVNQSFFLGFVKWDEEWSCSKHSTKFLLRYYSM